jgi:hypothetical protein
MTMRPNATGTSRFTAAMSGGSTVRTACSVSKVLLRRNGGWPPSEHFVYHRAEGEEVGAGIDGLAVDLFGRHVARGADDDAGHRRVGKAVGTGERRLQLRHAEVEDLDPAIRSDEGVLGLEIAVDDSAIVRGCEATRASKRDRDRLVYRKRPSVDPLAQALAFQAFGDEERDAPVLPDVMDCEDVRVIQRPCRAGLVCEAAQAFGIV